MNFPRTGLPVGFLAVICLCCVTTATAQVDQTVARLQGEYRQVQDQQDESTLGAQVIAIGDGQLKMQMFRGGLPGDGAVRFEPEGGVPIGKIDGEKATFKDGDRMATIQDGTLKIFHGDQLVRQLERIERESDTLGAKPPENAVVLFDGTSGDKFKARDGKPPVTDGLLRQGIQSLDKFEGDFWVHLEFKLPLEPNRSGQARGNSGFYIQGRYEIQMLDSFGLKGESNECGGIYDVKKPDVNMCYPPERWQTYDVDFKSAKWDGDKKIANARVTVKHNGVLIHDDIEIPAPTLAAPLKETNDPGYLYFQDHGSQVRYRNIWLVKQ